MSGWAKDISVQSLDANERRGDGTWAGGGRGTRVVECTGGLQLASCCIGNESAVMLHAAAVLSGPFQGQSALNLKSVFATYRRLGGKHST